jgi:alkylation response protein AidB-like acyl-CoA dehydrogenase
MDFTFSAEQEDLRAAVRRFLESERDLVRDVVDGKAFPQKVWSQMVELGWAGMLVPEEHGGTGLGLIDLVVVQEELGRLAFPGPFLSVLQATLALRRLDETSLLAELATGASRGTLALEEVGAGDPLDSLITTATHARLEGLKPVVLDGDTADWALVVARDDQGLGTYLVDQPDAEPVPGMDVTRRLARMELRGRPARRIGPAGDQTELLRRVVDDVAVALCAETVGACATALTMAVEYAKTRVQFGRPIGSFQAIRHKIVDMLHNLELARVGTHYAAWTSDVDDGERAVAASMAKGFVGEAANMITAENIQVHGGVGFTWDVDCHLYFRRVKQNDVLFGRGAWHRQRVAGLILNGGAPSGSSRSTEPHWYS